MAKTRSQNTTPPRPKRSQKPSTSIKTVISSLSISQIRSILGNQRSQYAQTGYVCLSDIVDPSTRLNVHEFNYEYILGVTLRRREKHERDSAKRASRESSQVSST